MQCCTLTIIEAMSKSCVYREKVRVHENKKEKKNGFIRVTVSVRCEVYTCMCIIHSFPSSQQGIGIRESRVQFPFLALWLHIVKGGSGSGDYLTLCLSPHLPKFLTGSGSNSWGHNALPFRCDPCTEGWICPGDPLLRDPFLTPQGWASPPPSSPTDA